VSVEAGQQPNPSSLLPPVDVLPDNVLVIDRCAGMAMVVTPAELRGFYDIAEVVWNSRTWGEFASGILQNDGDVFEGIFGCSSVEEAAKDWDLGQAFSPDHLATSMDIPQSPVIGWGARECIGDLYEPIGYTADLLLEPPRDLWRLQPLRGWSHVRSREGWEVSGRAA